MSFETTTGSAGSARPRLSQPGASLAPRRRWLFRLAAMVLIPCLLLGGTELALRLVGYGYPTTFFRPLQIGGKEYLVDNDKFGWRFFPPEISRSPSPMRIEAHKPPGTYRIFILGESAALGDPEPAFGMGRYLQALLQERYPETRFEVVPAAMTAINSHAVLPIARECANHEGDLWIVYMGNNEMIGPFGAVTVFGTQSPPLWYARLNVGIQKTRLGQLLVSLGRRLAGSGKHGASWGGMQMFMQNRIAPDDPRRERVYHAFRSNLEDILRAGRAAGVPMLLSTVAVNLKDCAPFGSLPELKLSATTERAQFDKLSGEGEEAQGRGDVAEAVQKFEAAARIEPRYADLQYRWGQILLGQSNAPSARTHFEQARDDDALPFRTDSRMNDIIRQTGARMAGRDLVLWDAAGFVATNSPVGIPGDETFYEHVHFNFDGNYRLAVGLANAVVPLLPANITRQARPAWATQRTCESDLGLTDWNRRDVYETMRRRFLQPPFTVEPSNAQKAQAWRLRVREMAQQLTPDRAEVARRVYTEALSRWPEDFRLHINYAAFLEERHDLPGALAEWKKVEGLLPHYYLAYYQAGRLLAQEGQAQEARKWLGQALEMRPDLSEGWYELGRVQGAGGQFQDALQSFERARRLVPGESRYHAELGKALVKLGRRDEAIVQLQEALRLGGPSWETHYLLGEQLAFAGQIPEAGREFEATLRLKPDYAMAHLNLGVALVKTGRLEDAQRQFEETLRLEPDNDTARQALLSLRKAGR